MNRPCMTIENVEKHGKSLLEMVIVFFLKNSLFLLSWSIDIIKYHSDRKVRKQSLIWCHFSYFLIVFSSVSNDIKLVIYARYTYLTILLSYLPKGHCAERGISRPPFRDTSLCNAGSSQTKLNFLLKIKIVLRFRPTVQETVASSNRQWLNTKQCRLLARHICGVRVFTKSVNHRISVQYKT